MFERLRASLNASDESKIVPLALAEMPSVLPRGSAFYTGELADAITHRPQLAWRVQGTSEYIIGGRWRRRDDIGSVEELHAKSNRGRLLGKLAERLLAEGDSLLVVGTNEQERNLGVYLAEGFEVIDEIVRYQRHLNSVPRPDPAVQVRGLRDLDLDSLLEVDHAAFPWLWWNSREEFDWYLDITGVEALVALEQERVVGYAGFTISGRQGHLDRLAVLPERQGQGIGKALVCHTLARMLLRRAERVALTTQVDNHRSATLYRGLGFSRTSLRFPIYGRWLVTGSRPRSVQADTK